MSQVALSLGANLDQPVGKIEHAIDQLTELFENVQFSSLYSTEPIGGPDQPDYVNAAMLVETTLFPRQLLLLLNGIEQQFGRVRNGERNQPRTLDIDIILYDQRRQDDDVLTLPHPRFRDRRFVLEPLAEIAPEMIDPVTQKTIQQLLADCPDQHQVVRMEEKTHA